MLTPAHKELQEKIALLIDEHDGDIDMQTQAIFCLLVDEGIVELEEEELEVSADDDPDED